MDLVVLTNNRVKFKKSENRNRYLSLTRELRKPRNTRETLIPIVVIGLGTVPKGLERDLEELEIAGRINPRERPSANAGVRFLRSHGKQHGWYEVRQMNPGTGQRNASRDAGPGSNSLVRKLLLLIYKGDVHWWGKYRYQTFFGWGDPLMSSLILENLVTSLFGTQIINNPWACSHLPTPPLEQDMTQGQFLSGVLQVWIQSFPSPRLVASPRLKNSVCPTIYP